MMGKIVLLVFAAVLAVASAGMVGGFQNVDVNDEGVQNAINVSVVHHNKGTNDMYLRQVEEVVSAERQVVAGMKYRITLRLAKSTCRKDRANDECAIHTDPKKAQPYECVFTVWSRVWLKEIKVTHERCE
ncbi:cystatin C (amyloid angiopathy and cerebral hemorrhage) [Sebastes fasciatus]|uniref:cystatin C (amyloid angiopathy and cerebral hemorrhage) n=1 Tax=Sebastes fasciatus TaxID=394691 RepID=UPI003D9E52A0